MEKSIGILALQGAFEKQVECLSILGEKSQLVRKPDDLKHCYALIIPGGESTTISLLIQKYDLYEPLKSFAKKHPILGICAGMIMMATEAHDERVSTLGIIPFEAIRNHYGTQSQSFSADIKLQFDNKDFLAHFIRAPLIKQVSDEVDIIARHNNDAVMIKKNKHIALSFHPELTADIRIHEYWLNQF